MRTPTLLAVTITALGAAIAPATTATTATADADTSTPTAAATASPSACASPTPSAATAVVLASGDPAHLVDAVPAAALAAQLHTGVILAPKTGDSSELDAYAQSHNDLYVFYVIGGLTAVSADATDSARAYDHGLHVIRLAGYDRYATSGSVAQRISALQAAGNTIDLNGAGSCPP